MQTEVSPIRFLAFSRFVSSPLRLIVFALGGPMVALGLLSAMIGRANGIACAFAVTVVAVLVVIPLVPQRVTVEADGVTLRWLFRTRQIPFDEIASFNVGRGWLRAGVMMLRAGERIALLPVGYQFGAADDAGRRIAARLVVRPAPS